MTAGTTAQAVRGGELTPEIVAFWREVGGLSEQEAHARVPEAVSVVRRDEDGVLLAVLGVIEAELEVVAARAFWVAHRLVRPGASGCEPALERAAYDALCADFDPRDRDAPLGLAVLLDDRGEMKRRAAARWSEPDTVFAGYLGDGRQIRLAYFAGAKIDDGRRDPLVPLAWQLEPGFAVTPFDDQHAIDDTAVKALWAREAAVDPEEAERRVHEVLLVATDPAGELAGVASAYLARSPLLGVDLWHFRAFVASAHRAGNVATNLAMRGRDLLRDRFATGEDTRGAGVVYEVENEGLKRSFNDAQWLPTDFVFVGHNERGDHVRVHWFPGALAPDPPR